MSVKQPPKLKKRQLTTSQKKKPNFSLGHSGEKKAIDFLISQGFEILDSNVRFKNHEVDVIAFDPKYEEIVFVEVKTRSSDDFGDPSLAVSRNKIRSMQMVINWYIKLNIIKSDYRIDIISVLPNEIRHFESVTW